MSNKFLFQLFQYFKFRPQVYQNYQKQKNISLFLIFNYHLNIDLPTLLDRQRTKENKIEEFHSRIALNRPL